MNAPQRAPMRSRWKSPRRWDVVWHALVDANELRRWFALEARVTPGPGGSIWLSWDDQFEGECPIRIWEPPHHLQTAWPEPGVATLSRESDQPQRAEPPVHLRHGRRLSGDRPSMESAARLLRIS
jgi:uncharacterized protein YndB with AHSA1/START domain